MPADAPVQASPGCGPQPDVRCGTCEYWPECDDPLRWRLCRFYPVEPRCVVDRERVATTADDGVGCPCWQKRIGAG